MAIYAYADETIFTINTETNEVALGCGILISKIEITENLINEAMTNLANDAEFDTRNDKRTIEYKYFHSSEDSKNGHSHFCKAINKHVKGIFDYTFVDNIKQIDIKKSDFSEKIFNRCLSSSTLELFQSTDEVFLTIEKRDTISEHTISKWKDQLYKSYEGSTYNNPTYKTYYPKLNIILKGKTEPGLQVVDFLMWAANRTKTFIPNLIWHSRLQYKTWYSYEDVGNQNRAKYHLNTIPNDVGCFEDYPFKFNKYEEWEQFLNAYVLIERFLVNIDKSDFKEINFHLFQEFNEISTILKNIDYYLTNDDFKKIGSIYLRLFDTLPIYSHIQDNDKDPWTLLLNSKYLASMLVRNDKMHFNRTRDAIHRWRYNMQTQNPDIFKELIYG
jgi:hypothetical protein